MRVLYRDVLYLVQARVGNVLVLVTLDGEHVLNVLPSPELHFDPSIDDIRAATARRRARRQSPSQVPQVPDMVRNGPYLDINAALIQAETPWGPADYVNAFAPGFVFYSTPSHGGYRLSQAANAQVPTCVRLAGGWYEEDCAWATVALTFPEHFPATALTHALAIVAQYLDPATLQAWLKGHLT